MAFSFNAMLNFKLNEAAQGGMEKAKTGFDNLKDSVTKANEAMAKIGAGVKGSAVSLAPLTAGMGLSIKRSADFEQGLDAVQAAMLATDEEMRPLANLTKQLGAATKFSALEATEGAKFLAQAGFNVTQIMDALPGVMDAAAAGEVDLATTADIVASSLGAFGLKAKDAGKVADVLALTSSITNTNMVGLGEGLKYAAATASQAGMSLQDTASALGILSNAGLKGSMAGTALQAAITQLTTPSKKVLELFNGQQGLNQAVLDATGNLLPFEVIIANISKVVNNSSDKLQSAGKAAEIFGLRGQKAFGAFSQQLLETVVVNDVMLKRFQAAGVNIEKEGLKVGSVIPSLVAMRYQINGAAGSAEQMAKIRMGNLLGQFEQLSGAIEGLGIETGGLFLKELTGDVNSAADAVSILVAGFQALSMSEEEVTKMQTAMQDSNNKMYNKFASFLPMTRLFAEGFRDGFNEVIGFFKETGESANKYLSGIFGDEGFSPKQLGKMIAQIIIIGGTLAPVLAGLVAVAFAFNSVFTMITGFFSLLSASWGAISAASTAIYGAAEVIAVVLGVSVGTVGLVAIGIIAAVAAIIYFREEIVQFGIDAFDTFMSWNDKFDEFIFNAQDKTTTMFSNATDKMMTFFTTNGEKLKNALTGPFNSAIAIIQAGFKTLEDNTPEWMKSAAKFSIDFLTNGLPQLAPAGGPSFDLPDNPIVKANNEIAFEGSRQSSIVQPPSADSIASIISSQSSSSSGGQNQSTGSPQTVKVVVEGRISGSDINLVQSRSQIEQSQLNGRTIDPITKRRAIQNGNQFKE